MTKLKQPGLFLGLLLILASFNLAAQLGNRYAAMHNNFQQINPAAINHILISRYMPDNYIVTHLQHQAQRIDGDNSLINNTARVEYINRDERIVFGAGFQKEKIHVHNRIRSSFNGSKHWNLMDGNRQGTEEFILSGGLAGAFTKNATEVDDLRYATPGDPAVPISSEFISEVAGGLFIMRKHARAKSSKGPIIDWYAGLSGYRTLGSRDYEPGTQWNMMTGLIFSRGRKEHLFEVNTWARYSDAGKLLFDTRQTSKLTIDGNIRYWRNASSVSKGTTFFAGGGYSSNGRARLEAGTTLLMIDNSSLQPVTISLIYDFNVGNALQLGSLFEVYLSVPIKI